MSQRQFLFLQSHQTRINDHTRHDKAYIGKLNNILAAMMRMYIRFAAISRFVIS